MQKNISIAIDGGHSMFKVRAALSSAPNTRISLQIPTVVMPAILLTNEQTKLRAEGETVELHGKKYFFGETALRQGRSEVFTGQNSDWIESIQHDVLLLGAWFNVMREIGSGPARIHLVMGLPAKYLSAQKSLLRERVTALLTPRLLPGQTLRVLIQSQADAPLQWISLDTDGALNKQTSLDSGAWGVIEIGHFTTDFALSEQGSMVEYAVASCAGMNLAYEAIASALAAERLPTALDVVERAIRTREIKLFGKPQNVGALVERAMAGFEAIVLDEANRIFGDKAATLDGIVVGGGGAELLFAKLRDRFPNAICDDNPRMMVAEGFCRLGLMSLSRV